jgi:peptide/nickel transport system ATP-binding protein
MVEFGKTEDIFKNPLHPYTQALLSAVPTPDPKAKMERIVLEGSIPSPANPPKGCKFHTRCSKCMECCKTEIPEVREIEPGHKVACHLYKDQGKKVDSNE